MVLSLAGVVLVATAAWTTWTAPDKPAGTGHPVLVRLPEGPVCGDLLAVQDGRVLLSVGGTVRTVPVAGVTLEPRERC
jgi:hypothetical protein